MKMYRSIGDLNPYALDYPVCSESKDSNGLSGDGSSFGRKYGRSQRAWLINYMMESLGELHGFSESGLKALKTTVGLEPVNGYEPCEEDYMTSYLNQASVKSALHVKTDIDWLDCSRSIRYKQTDGKNSMVPIYKYLIEGNFGLNILVYSGDNDDVCATIGAQDWIWGLGYQVSGKRWAPYIVNGQTGGYTTKWDTRSTTNFGFTTVHGAGHEVPTYKPDVALWLFDSYMKGELTSH
jgi:carboxypeptidase C (cathepsin A)